MRGGVTAKCGYNSWLAYVQPLRTLPQVANRSRNTPQPFKNISSSMAFGSHLLVNLTILTLICVIIFALISCVEAALNDSGSLRFFLYLLYSYLGVAGVRADDGDSDNGDSDSDGGDGVDASDGGGYGGYC